MRRSRSEKLQDRGSIIWAKVCEAERFEQREVGHIRRRSSRPLKCYDRAISCSGDGGKGWTKMEEGKGEWERGIRRRRMPRRETQLYKCYQGLMEKRKGWNLQGCGSGSSSVTRLSFEGTGSETVKMRDAACLWHFSALAVFQTFANFRIQFPFWFSFFSFCFQFFSSEPSPGKTRSWFPKELSYHQRPHTPGVSSTRSTELQ